MNFETVIGLEVHIALNTASKVYSPSTNGFEAEPNENVNPIDLAYPGTLALINEEAINYAMKAALALNCEIATDTNFDRKNYYYPDMPKAYQISQDDKPIGQNGWVDIEVNGKQKRIGITRIDRKSTRLNSSHVAISYAVSCLKKKKQRRTTPSD